MSWDSDFKNKIRAFETAHITKNGLVISIKIGPAVTQYGAVGCYHRQCSPHAYEIIDTYLKTTPLDKESVKYEEHESGAELLVFLALGTAGISLAKSVIDLVITIIKARQEGIKAGDHRDSPIQLRIRRVESAKTVKEDIILNFTPCETVDKIIINEALQDYINKLTANNTKKGHRKRE